MENFLGNFKEDVDGARPGLPALNPCGTGTSTVVLGAASHCFLWLSLTTLAINLPVEVSFLF